MQIPKALLTTPPGIISPSSTTIDNATFLYKTALSEANSRTEDKIEWEIQNGPVTTNGVFPLAILIF